ncbi:MAG: hypothetical protein ABSG76_22490, partial [Xanthobacteraceae bacterium]
MMNDDSDRGTGATKLGRRSFMTAAGAAAAGTALAGLAGTSPARAQSVAWKQAGNNGHVLELQGGGGK